MTFAVQQPQCSFCIPAAKSRDDFNAFASLRANIFVRDAMVYPQALIEGKSNISC